MNYELQVTKKVIKVLEFRKKSTNKKRIAPSKYSKNKKERVLGVTLSTLKTAKHNPETARRKFYPSLDKVAEAYGEPKLFDKIDKKAKAISSLYNVLNWIKENERLPKRYYTDELSKKKEYEIAIVYQNLLLVKSGKLFGVWYKEFDNIIEEYGFSEFFKVGLENVMVSSDIKDLIQFYKKHNRNPTQLSKSDVEKKLYRKLIRLKQVKQGKTCQLWNPDIDEQIKKLKIKNIFN